MCWIFLIPWPGAGLVDDRIADCDPAAWLPDNQKEVAKQPTDNTTNSFCLMHCFLRALRPPFENRQQTSLDGSAWVETRKQLITRLGRKSFAEEIGDARTENQRGGTAIEAFFPLGRLRVVFDARHRVGGFHSFVEQQSAQAAQIIEGAAATVQMLFQLFQLVVD